MLPRLTGWKRQAVFGIAALLAVVLLAVLAASLRDALEDRKLTAVATLKSATVEQLLGPREFARIGGTIGPDFVPAENDSLVLLAGGRLIAVDRLGAAIPDIAEIAVAGDKPDSFAMDRDGTILALAGGFLGLLNEDGTIAKGVPQTFDNMRLNPSSRPGAFYMFGGTAGQYRLYRFISDGTLQVLLDVDEPVTAAADHGQDIYAATAGAILHLKPGKPDVLFTAPPGMDPIISLAIGTDGLVMFSTAKKVYALIGPNALSIVTDAGGSLRVHAGKLYVLDPDRKLLFSLTPASTGLFESLAK